MGETDEIQPSSNILRAIPAVLYYYATFSPYKYSFP